MFICPKNSSWLIKVNGCLTFISPSPLILGEHSHGEYIKKNYLRNRRRVEGELETEPHRLLQNVLKLHYSLHVNVQKMVGCIYCRYSKLYLRLYNPLFITASLLLNYTGRRRCTLRFALLRTIGWIGILWYICGIHFLWLSWHHLTVSIYE